MNPVMPEIKRIDHFVLTARDVGASVAFYTQVLGMTSEQFQPTDGTIRWALTFGENKINLHQSGAEFLPNAKAATVGAQDVCFITDDPLEIWQEHFTHCNVIIEEGPVERTGAVGKIVSLYIRDPDGNLIEVSRYV